MSTNRPFIRPIVLTLDETAEALRISTDTVKRDWRFAKAWLEREIGNWRAR